MLKIVSTALVCMMLQMPALAASEDSSWYNANPIQTHINNPPFSFLLGDWESSDPSVVFKESWNTTANGDLFGYRSFQEGGQWEYDLYAFEQTLIGAAVNMRRMGFRLCDLPEKLVNGKWFAPINHRGEISFPGVGGQDLTISNKYDSPDQNTLILQIQTTSKGVTTSKKLILRRSAPTKIKAGS